MSSSPTQGIGGEAARSESKQGGPEGLRAFLHDAFRGGAELRQVRRSERPPPAQVPTLGPRLYLRSAPRCVGERGGQVVSCVVLVRSGVEGT